MGYVMKRLFCIVALVILLMIAVLLTNGCAFSADSYQYEDDILEMINEPLESRHDIGNWIMHNIESVSDFESYGKLCYFDSPYETVRNKQADCDGFASLYMYLMDVVLEEETTAVIGLKILLPWLNHVMVEDAYHDYLYSPQNPFFKFYEEDYDVIIRFNLDTVMSIWTNNGAKSITENEDIYDVISRLTANGTIGEVEWK